MFGKNVANTKAVSHELTLDFETLLYVKTKEQEIQQRIETISGTRLLIWKRQL